MSAEGHAEAPADAAALQQQAEVNNDRLEIVLLCLATGLSVVLVSCLWVFVALF